VAAAGSSTPSGTGHEFIYWAHDSARARLFPGCPRKTTRVPTSGTLHARTNSLHNPHAFSAGAGWQFPADSHSVLAPCADPMGLIGLSSTRTSASPGGQRRSRDLCHFQNAIRFTGLAKDQCLSTIPPESLHSSRLYEAVRSHPARNESSTIQYHLTKKRPSRHIMNVKSRAFRCVAPRTVRERKAKTPMLAADEARILLDSIDTSTVMGPCDRALIALMAYTFARVGSAANRDESGRLFRPGPAAVWVRLYEERRQAARSPGTSQSLCLYRDIYKGLLACRMP